MQLSFDAIFGAEPAAEKIAPKRTRGQEHLERLGVSRLRPAQERAVEAFESARDVIVLLPTGYGKSLCYQLPALRRPGLMLVVSPLISLMEDQVSALRAKGIAAAVLHSGLSYRDRDAVMDGLADLDLLYVSPERVAVKRFRNAIRRHLTSIAIDEAHCISEWGHDFRKDYLTLGVLRAELGPGVPIMALTATATPRVTEEMARSLGLVDPLRVTASFTRANLHMAVEHISGDKARVERVAELLEGIDGRAVIYAGSRKRTAAVCKELRKRGFAAGYYHAGRSDSARANAQAAYDSGKKPILVATTAFGMGIDHPDVRLVAHIQAPGSLEAWYQQAGRAGRDGQPARCVLLYSPADAVLQARLRGPSPGAEVGWKALQDFVFGTDCRQRQVGSWFGFDEPACGVCDVCVDADAVQEMVDGARSAGRARRDATRKKRAEEDTVVLDVEQQDLVIAFVGALKKPVGKVMVARGLRGSRAKAVKRVASNPHFGALKGVPERAVVRTIETMLDDGRLARRGKKYPTVWLPDKRVRAATPRTSAKAKPKPRGLAAALKNYRKRQARKKRWKPYQVFSNAVLDAIVAARPRSLEDLEAIKGMGPKKVSRFGEDILGIVEEVVG